jgi:uncharacterized protein YuzE
MLPGMFDPLPPPPSPKPPHPVYCRRAEAEIRRSHEVHPGVVVDLDAEGEVIGVEVLDVIEVTVDHAAYWKAP